MASASTAPAASSLRSRILRESQLASRKKTEIAPKTWTKRFKYEGYQSTLDSNKGLTALKPSKVAKSSAPKSHRKTQTRRDSLRHNDDDPQGLVPQDDPILDQHFTLHSYGPDPLLEETRTGERNGTDAIMVELDRLNEQAATESLAAIKDFESFYGTEPTGCNDETSDSPVGDFQPIADDTRSVDIPELYPRRITSRQLIAEVKSIYKSLQYVEARCIQVDKAHLSLIREPQTRLPDDHFEALTSIHRTLLHEHHDFFLATQHPAATPALRRLAMKYSMPARMWKHGIHSFLGFLRYTTPEQLEAISAYIADVQGLICTLQQQNIPDADGDWLRIQEALAEYQKLYEQLRGDLYRSASSPSDSDKEGPTSSQSLFDRLHKETRIYSCPTPDDAMAYRNWQGVFGQSTQESAPLQNGCSWLSQTAAYAASGWLYFGQELCRHDFGIFTKVFAILGCASMPLHVLPRLF